MGKEGNIKTVYHIFPLKVRHSKLSSPSINLSKCILIADENHVVIQLGCTHRTSDESEGTMRIAVGYTLTVQVSKFYTLALTFRIVHTSACQAFRPLTCRLHLSYTCTQPDTLSNSLACYPLLPAPFERGLRPCTASVPHSHLA